MKVGELISRLEDFDSTEDVVVQLPSGVNAVIDDVNVFDAAALGVEVGDYPVTILLAFDERV